MWVALSKRASAVNSGGGLAADAEAAAAAPAALPAGEERAALLPKHHSGPPDEPAWTPPAAQQQQQQPGGGGSGSSSWFNVLLLCALISVINSLDRMAMSVAILPISSQYGWSDSTKGVVTGAFNAGYMLTNLCGGYLAAAHGAKAVLAGGVAVWSAFTLATPLAAAAQWLPLLLATRAFMGLGEGVAFPCLQVIIKGVMPPDRRARALSLVYSGHQLGAVLALITSPSIIASLGWPWVFLVFGSLGLVWLLAWRPLALPAAAGCSGGSPAAAKPVRWRDVPWGRFAREPACWALLVCHVSFGVLYNIANGWLPIYFHSYFGLDVKGSAHSTVPAFVSMALCTNASGWAADALVNTGLLSTLGARKALQAAGTLVPAACLLHLAAAGGGGGGAGLRSALALLTAVMGGLGLQAGGFASNHTDISTRWAGSLFGATNCASSLAGSVATVCVGFVLQRTGGAWSLVFRGVAALQLAALAAFVLLAKATPLFE